MTVHLRTWRDGDDLRLLEVLPAPEAEPVIPLRALFGPDADEPAWLRTIVAEDDGVMIGAGAVQLHPMHPERLWAYIEVATGSRGEGAARAIGTQLREIAAEAHPGRPLRTKAAPGTSGAGFAVHIGMEPVMTHRHVVIAPGALPPQPLGEGDTATEAVEDLATGSVELTRAVAAFYASANAWDAPAELSIGQVNRQFLSEASQAYGAVVLRLGVDRGAGRRGSIGAFAVSYRSLELDAERTGADPERLAELDDLPTDVLVGWDPSLSDQDAAIAVAKLLGLLVARYPVRVEVTDAMRPLAMVCAQLVADGVAKVVDEAVTYADPAV